MKKAEKVFIRLGFEDVIIPIENREEDVISKESYIVGYEDKDGVECNEDGTYLE